MASRYFKGPELLVDYQVSNTNAHSHTADVVPEPDVIHTLLSVSLPHLHT